MRIVLASLLMMATTAPTLAQNNDIGQPKGTWQTPGPIQQPKGNWQVPGEFQQPKGPWQQPGEIQIPKGIDAVRTTTTRCERRLSVVADALFDFDKSNLRPEAEETLAAAGPEIAKLGGKPARIEGHTDAIGSDAYNLKLSEARAASVREWLVRRGIVPPATATKGFGKTSPVAPNRTSDGRDDPEGRQKNRRVEVVFNTCS